VSDRTHVRANLLEGNAWLQSANAVFVRHPAVPKRPIRRLADWDISIARNKFVTTEIKVRRDDAHDGVGGTVQRNGLAQNCWLSGVSATPKTFAKKSDRRAAKMIVGASERAADKRFNSKRIEEFRRDKITLYMFRLCSARE
jgi:hypothetical protein